MSKYIHKSHNVSVAMYHYVCPTKYRRVIFDKRVDEILREICLEISKRYEIYFIEIGTDKDHVHFLVQSVPMYSPTQIIKIIKSITAREIFIRAPEVKKKLWGGQFWSKGFYFSTVGKYGNEEMILRYVKLQGIEKDYKTLYKGTFKPGQMTLWEEI
jgi:REP element-mobilizing transposase RayT